MRKKIVAGNWKMNLLSDEAVSLTKEISEKSSNLDGVDIIVFPPSLFIQTLVSNFGTLNIAAQNFHPEEKGAYTGEISIAQLKDLGVSHVLIGHSERREIFGENAGFIKKKIDAAIDHQIIPVFCCGEPLDIREAGNELHYVKQQLLDSLFHLSAIEVQKCIIAYEPVWAIGTGKTASVQQAEDMHKSIRTWIAEYYEVEVAQNISILYGGSCNASNAAELFACPNVDGGLIGGASLKADSFLQIAQSF